MKIITLLLMLVCGMAFGQNGTIQDLTYKPTKSELIGTHISLQISPSMPDSMVVTDKELFIAVTGWNLLRYEIEVYGIKKHNPCDYKCVDLRIINRGKITDYTFSEFRKMLLFD